MLKFTSLLRRLLAVPFRPPVSPAQPLASEADEALAKRIFPYRSKTPVEYVDEEGDLEIWKPYARMRFRDADLEVWLRVVSTTLPLASAWNEEHALALFPFQTVSAEHFAATDEFCSAGEFLYDGYRYRDPALMAWLRRVGEVLRNPEALTSAKAVARTRTKLGPDLSPLILDRLPEEQR